jgi:F-type H+-transporting ATPase subunit a
MVTGVFALAVFVLSLTVGFWYHGFGYVKAFVPSGIPRPRRRGLLGVLFFIGYMLFMVFMVVIEIISVVARPITLAVRLFANMTAGHMVILIFLGLMFMGGLWVGWLPFAMTVPIYLLEVFVAFMQAYVFVMLTCVFVGMAMHPH